MNERIKELKEQAMRFAQEKCEGKSRDMYGSLRADIMTEKFAELIVRECAKFLDENSGYDNSNNAWHPEPEDLLKHFGVEE